MLPDNYDLWVRYDAEQEEKLNKLPKCAECGEAIQDEYCYEINNEYICEHCIRERRVSIDLI